MGRARTRATLDRTGEVLGEDGEGHDHSEVDDIDICENLSVRGLRCERASWIVDMTYLLLGNCHCRSLAFVTGS